MDLSPRAGQTLARSRFSTSARFASRALVPALLLAVWQASSNFGLVAPEVLPSPAEIIAAYAELIRTGELQAAIPASFARALTGLALGASVGLVLGLFAGLWRVGEELFDAPLQMLRTIPFIAMIPLFIIWFGIGEQAKIALIFGATIFPVYLNTYSGVRGVDQKLIEAARVFGLSHGRIATRVIIPTALPSILVGLRFAASVSLLALVAAGATAVLVTHDVDEAVFLGHRIVVLHPRPGRIAAVLEVPEAARADRSSPAFVALRDRVLELLGVSLGEGRAR
ncbi:ABC transporter permease subunit [Xanthobacter flavus]|uniref:ABC transporter permease subunit n=1 Tax=Xanthobacter flavus TaxID=281 RepID=UPI00372AF4E5